MSTPNQNNAPQYSPVARALLDTFAAAKYPSHLRHPTPELSIMRAENNKDIDANEREVALRALQHCRDLMKPNPPFPPEDPEGGSPVDPNTPVKPWSPSDVLDSMGTEVRVTSGVEQSLPKGDR